MFFQNILSHLTILEITITAKQITLKSNVRPLDNLNLKIVEASYLGLKITLDSHTN